MEKIKNKISNKIISNAIQYLKQQIRNIEKEIESCNREYDEAIKLDIGFDNPYANIPLERKKVLQDRLKQIKNEIKCYEKVEING